MKSTSFPVLNLFFSRPKARRLQIERWMRGRREFKKLKRADAVVVSFGKSGRTWLRVMISRFYSSRYSLRESSLMSFDNMHIMNRSVPVILFTHDNYLKNYTGNRDNKSDYYDNEVVLLVRNPLDVAVSQFFQWKYRMRPGKKALNDYPDHGSDIELYDFVIHPGVLPKIIEYLNLWAKESSNFAHLHIVHYEALRAETATELSKLARFIGAPDDQAAIEEAVRFASVENMRAMELSNTFWMSGSRVKAKDKSNPHSYKVRKAKVGGYRDYFDDDQISSLNHLVNEQLDSMFGYNMTDVPGQVALN